MNQTLMVEEMVVPSIMNAAQVVEPKHVEMVQCQVPKPGPNQLLVRLEGCGVCASNIPPWEGREWFNYPLEPGALGHEAWGEVISTGEDVSQFKIGDRVAMISSSAYAEFDVCDESSAVRLPEELAGKPFPAEPLGCAVNIFKRSGVKAGDVVAIVGIGFLGAILVRLCKRAGCRVIAISRRPFSLSFAKEMGADELIEMDDHWRIIDEVKRLTGNALCDVVVEAVGKQWPLDLSGELVKERGRLVVAGYHQDGPRQVNMQSWNWKGLDVINAHERDPAVYLQGMQEAVELVRSGELDVTSLFTHRFDLRDLAEALNATAERPDGFMKALVFTQDKGE